MYSNIGQKAVDSKPWRNIKDGFELRRLFLMVERSVWPEETFKSKQE